MIKEQIEYLSEFVLERRLYQLKKVLSMRTRHITVCLENLYHAQNASAVLRSCEAMGIQDVHIIESKHNYRIDSEIALGTENWLTLHKYQTGTDTLAVIKRLRKKGYRIIATTPHEGSVQLPDFDVRTEKAALFFGSEVHGLSEDVLSNADEFLHIPMYGFVESFNVSVSASIILNKLVEQLHKSELDWRLTEDEADKILFKWLKGSIKSSDLLLDRFERDRKNVH